MDLYNDTYLPDILHDIAQGLLIPAMIAILALLALTIFFFGQVIAEYFTERRHFKQNMPAIVNDLTHAAYDKVCDVVVASSLLKYQKAALVIVAKNMGLPEEPLFALAQLQVNGMEKRYRGRMAWTDTMAKIAPLLGLMGTLIPLGPGIVALGNGNVTQLSQSLLLAFDATVCGLVCAIICLVLSKIRSGWYTEYVDSLESIVTCLLDKAAAARKEGVALPCDYKGNPLKEFEALKTNKPADTDAARSGEVS